MDVKLIAYTMLMLEELDTPYDIHSTSTTGKYERDSDELAEVAGRVCYKSWARARPATATNRGYLSNIIQQQHFSVLEHASATFWISGVSRSLTHELVRHRHLSFSQVSQRYVDESNFEQVLHPALEEEGIDLDFEILRRKYSELVEDLVEAGYDRKTARGAARGVLPNATATEIIVTGNHRAWRDMLKKRLSSGADMEIRMLAQRILIELKKIAPNTYQDFEDGEDES